MLKKISSVIILFIYVVCATSIAKAAAEGGVYSGVPPKVNTSQKYLFYMHGSWIEKHGPNQPNPMHGYYEYDKIVEAFRKEGLVVISEMRLQEVEIKEYADKISGEVRQLLDRGVPPENITVIGHSKGGLISLIVAGTLEENELNFVIMAGCGKEGTTFRRGYEKFLDRVARRTKGCILSLYDADDHTAGSCSEAFDKTQNAKTKEIVLHAGLGHGLFYSPNPLWVKEVVNWTAVDCRGEGSRSNP